MSLTLSRRENAFMQKVIESAKNAKDFQFKIAAAVIYKNKIISLESNEKKSHTFQKRFAVNQEKIYFHAETSAIHSALKIIGSAKLKKAKLFVARVSPITVKGDKLVGHHLSPSKPCMGCLGCISHYGLKEVIHTDNGLFRSFTLH